MEIKTHPIYTDYGSDSEGNIYSFKGRRDIIRGTLHNNYLVFSAYLARKPKQFTFHKFIYECFNGLVTLSTSSGEGLTIDHINGNKLDNRLSNLQLLSQRKNAQKSHTNKFSKYVGVYKTIRNKTHYFRSYICIKGKSTYLGGFDLDLDAAIAFDDAYEKIHGLRPNKTNQLYGHL